MFISIDLDAFYCGVEEHDEPELRGRPFCVVQKHVVATLSYPARALGIKKLASIHAVRKEHPNILTVNGEDLTKYRAAGKMLYDWVRELIGGGPVERLGLEEMRLDLGPSVAASRERFPSLDVMKEWLADPDFMDDVVGNGAELLCGEQRVPCPNFYFNFEGKTWPPGQHQLEDAESLDAYIAGNLAQYIRDRMWLELGYSCSIGVAASKTYAKVACALNKPRGVTVVVPGHEAAFLRPMGLAKIPGFGRATRRVLEPASTVAELHEQLNSDSFAKKVGGLVGAKAAHDLWCTTVGEEPSDVGQIINDYVLPKQVSVEESYHDACPAQRWPSEVERLVDAVLIQTRTDCFDATLGEWKTVPHTMRLSVIFPNTQERRKSRSARFTWPHTPPNNIEAQLADLRTVLVQKARRLLQELASKKAPRVINIALVMEPPKSTTVIT